MNKNSKELIKQLVIEAEGLIPVSLEKNLPDLENNPGIPAWHRYEFQIWEIGERLRQELAVQKNLRRDKVLLESYLRICMNKRAKRGRNHSSCSFGINIVKNMRHN